MNKNVKFKNFILLTVVFLFFFPAFNIYSFKTLHMTIGIVGEFDDLESFFAGTCDSALVFCESALALPPLSSCQESKDMFPFENDSISPVK